jgi:hypothetical protein
MPFPVNNRLKGELTFSVYLSSLSVFPSISEYFLVYLSSSVCVFLLFCTLLIILLCLTCFCFICYLQPLVHRTTLNLYCFYEQFYVLPKLLINFHFILFSLLFFSLFLFCLNSYITYFVLPIFLVFLLFSLFSYFLSLFLVHCP